MAITASEAHKNLFPLIEQVNDDRTPIEITSRRGDAVLLARADYQALEAQVTLSAAGALAEESPARCRPAARSHLAGHPRRFPFHDRRSPEGESPCQARASR
jgi:antitoxin YefM